MSFFASPARANTVKKSATGAAVTHVFCPCSRYPPATLVAVVAMPPRSDPALGSVMQIAPIFSAASAGLNSRATMSSLPRRCRNLVPIKACIAAQPASDIEPRAISASASENVARSRPRPPTSAG